MNGWMEDLEYTLIVKEGNNIHLSPYLHEFTKMLANHNYLAIDLSKITLLFSFHFIKNALLFAYCTVMLFSNKASFFYIPLPLFFFLVSEKTPILIVLNKEVIFYYKTV